jgi:hypothetical protein
VEPPASILVSIYSIVHSAIAKKILRVILGPAPEDPEYATWWRGRLISVGQMKRDGQPVEWAEAPPVPLEPQEAPEAEKPAKPRKWAARRKPASFINGRHWQVARQFIRVW